MTVLAELEKIDDDCDRHGIQFVKIDDSKAAQAFGIDDVPAIVYFEKQIPNVYDGNTKICNKRTYEFTTETLLLSCCFSFILWVRQVF